MRSIVYIFIIVSFSIPSYSQYPILDEDFGVKTFELTPSVEYYDEFTGLEADPLGGLICLGNIV